MTWRVIRRTSIGLACVAALISSATLKAQGRSSWLPGAVDVQGVRHLAREGKHSPWLDDAIKTVTPKYPYDDKALRHAGSGWFRLTLDLNTGSVSKVTVIESTGFPKMDNEATYAFRQWRWKPRTWKEIDIPVIFTLRRGGQAAELERYLESQRKKSFEKYRREHGVPSPTPNP